MASFTGINGTHLSTATATDPKAMKNHLSTGTPISSHPELYSLSARRDSELPSSEPPSETPRVSEVASQRSEDNADDTLENKGKKTMNSQNPTNSDQATPSTFDPRRLLDPKGFNKDQRQRDPKSTLIDSSSAQPGPSNVQLNGKAPENNGDPIKSKVNGSQKRDLEDWDGRGMGSLIEKVHNVSQREQRPQKKPKVEHGDFDVEEDKRAGFVGGGQGGGEIGDYLKEKKKQGIAESGTVNGVVDLTGGTYILLKQNVPQY